MSLILQKKCKEIIFRTIPSYKIQVKQLGAESLNYHKQAQNYMSNAAEQYQIMSKQYSDLLTKCK